jgi:hypothetical protein
LHKYPYTIFIYMTNTALSTMLTIAALVTLVIALYLTFTETWPAIYLIDYQAVSDGMYSPKLTFAIGVLLAGGSCCQENEGKK